MMQINREFSKDGEVQLLCIKHISNTMAEMLVVEKDFYNDVYSDEYESFEDYLVERIFPPNTTANKNIVKFYEKTIEMLRSDEIYEMNILHEYIIFSAIENYYEGSVTEYDIDVSEEEGLNIQRIENREKIIEKVRECAIELAEDVFDGEQTMEKEILDALTYLMQLVEDMTIYTENLEDIDFEFLNECSFDKLMEINKIKQLGIRF